MLCNPYRKTILPKHTNLSFYVLVKNCNAKQVSFYVYVVAWSCFMFAFYVNHAVCYYK